MNKTTTFICVINNKPSSKYDEGQCIIGGIFATLYNYDFGFICMGFLGIIIYISIFGGIKQNYRWFILNQAIWDIFKSFEFSCNNYFENAVTRSPGCFYYFKKGSGYLNEYISSLIMNNIYGPWLLISVTRFIALYFVNLYNKLTHGYRIIFTIFIFNLFMIILDSEMLINAVLSQRSIWLISECKMKETLNSTTTLCTVTYVNQDFIVSILSPLYKICVFVRVFKPEICLLISTFSTIMIILKIAKQAKFQMKHNRRDFLNSARIAAVISSQTIMNFLIFVVQFLGTFTTIVGLLFSVPVRTVKWDSNTPGIIDFRLPLWLDGSLGLTGYGGQQIITQSRIFIESIIVLGIMTGYREAIVIFFQKLYLLIRSPRKFIRSFKKASPQNTWT